MKARFAEVEKQILSISGPAKRIVSPHLKWLRDNRDDMAKKYPNEWIAVSEEGLLGHDTSLKALHSAMTKKGIKKSTYVHVSEPLSPR